ncbi:MAG: M16 family metallopeptidase [Nostoc sp. ChiSLP01]|nr:pitrilysin family protein [Nostoc sp. CmiSLP01]MDZ8282774.1 pitrilysin family protein [Nostoc sp. ChiSLP01]
MVSTLTENVRKTVLENGLIVLTKEVHTAPVVTVQVWYKIGSRNEEPGVNGIAHQLEHMMFKGTKNRPIQFGRLFSALGSDSNAFTSYDQTAYYGTVERSKLKALLVLEADRMQNSQIEPEQLTSEKRVVISELQGYENSPEYRLNRAVMQAMFPNHAYGLPVGGMKADVEKFELEQVEKYYRNFYTPDNAVLVIVGDFQTANTLEMVKEVFGELANRQEARFISPSFPSLTTHHSPLPSPIILREPGVGRLLQAVYPLPNVNQPDVPALDVMDYILTEGRNSRLYQALVESGLAREVTASVTSLREFGWYEVLVTAAFKQDLKKIDSVLNSAIANVAKKGVTLEEVERAKTQLTADVILSNRDITSQGMQLGHDETTADDYRYTDRYLAAVRLVKPTDVVAVINKYLTKEARTVGFFEPTHKQTTEVGQKPDLTQTTENFSAVAPVLVSEVVKYLPNIDLVRDGLLAVVGQASGREDIAQTPPQQFQFDNGLRLLLLRDSSTPTVTLSGYIQAGTEFDSNEQAGLAAFVAENLLSGTKTKDALTIAKTLAERGASLDFHVYPEGVQIEGDSLAPDLPILIEILADVVKNSTFPVKELELHRQQTLTDLQIELDEPSEVARRIFVQSIYPQKHPLNSFPTEKSLQRIKRQDLIDFKARHYRPDTMVLVIVGDFELEPVRSLIESKLADWEVSGQPPTLKYPTVSLPEKIVSVNRVLADKAQAVTYIGHPSINRYDSRFYAVLLLNQILGGDTLSSRLGTEVRDRQGLSYGIYSYFLVGKNAGTFLIEMQTNPEDSTKAIASTRQILQQIHQQGVTALEVETAKRTLIGNYNVSLTNPEDLTDTILMNEVYGLDQVELHCFTQKIQQVTLEQVNQAAWELIHPDRIVIATAGPGVS